MFTKQIQTFGIDLDYSKIYSEVFLDYINQFKKFEDELTPFVVYNGIPIIFDPTWKRIGLTMSGGADSTLLFYILCDIITKMNLDTKLTPVTLVRYWDERPWLTISSKRVYAYMKERFPNVIEERQMGFVPHAVEFTSIHRLDLPKHQIPKYKHYPETVTADVYFVDQFMKYTVDNFKIEAFFSGVTTNPEVITLDEHPYQIPPAGREKKIIDDSRIKGLGWLNETDLKTKYKNSDPFQYINKDWVMAQYTNLDLEDLLNMTRSCQEVIPGFHDPDILPDACGTCYFCQERHWGTEHGKQFLKERN
jgi:hypothetical protein